MYFMCAFCIIFSALSSNASSVVLQESSTVLSFQSSPSLKTMKIPENVQPQEGLALNIEIDNPNQESNLKTFHEVDGNIHITVMLYTGTVRSLIFPVTTRSTSSQSLCLNPSLNLVEDFKVILISDLATVKNITIRLEKSDCHYNEPCPTSDCVETGVVAFILTIFLFMGLLVTAFYLIIKVTIFQNLKTKLLKLIKNKPDEDSQVIKNVVDPEKVENVSEDIPVLENKEIKQETKDQVKKESYTRPPRDEFNTIETNVGIILDNEPGSGLTKIDAAENKLKRIFDELVIKFKSIQLQTNKKPNETNSQPTINFIVNLDGGEESLEKFMDKVKEDPRQYVIRLNVNVRVSIQAFQGHNQELAKSEINEVLQNLNLNTESKIKYHSDKDNYYRFNVNLKGDKDKFELFKKELNEKVGVGIVEIGTWDSVDVKVTMRGLDRFSKEKDLKNTFRGESIRGDITFYGRAFSGNNTHEWKYNIKLYGDMETFGKFKEHLDMHYKSSNPRVELGSF